MAVVSIDTSTLPGMILTEVVDESRRKELQRGESFFRCTHYRHRHYLFDGSLDKFAGHSGIFSEDYIPMRLRQPSHRLDLPTIIVSRLTAMLFGHNRFPRLDVHGDPLSQDFVRQLAIEARLPVKLIEARNIGGSCGSVALSWGFVDGKPVVEVHRASMLEVLQWEDYERRRPKEVVKAYKYSKRVKDERGRLVPRTFWYVRHWTPEIDQTWKAIPEKLANTSMWWSVAESETVRHESGICPVYWIQNIPDSDSVDGVSDYDGQEDCFESGDTLYSATGQGTVANVDPTLVIKDDKRQNDGVVRKGSQYAIYSPGGAEYLEINGSAVDAGVKLLELFRQNELDVAAIVVPNPDKMTALGVSGKALEMQYLPMLSKCDLLREQYGDALVQMLRDMVTVAQTLRSSPREGADGELYWARVVLDPKIEETEQGTKTTERAPGESAQVTLAWPPYFPATWADRKEAVTAVKEGTGGKQVISQRTATGAIATLLEIEDVDAELERIDEEAELGLERAQRAFETGAPRLGLQGKETEGEGSRESDDDDGEEEGSEQG